LKADPPRRILITGAGGGLGRALALRYAKAGWKVACTDRDLVVAESTLTEVRSAGAEGVALECDVTSEESFAAVAQQLHKDWGGVDVLVNNAGVATAGTVLDSPIEQWRWVLDINLLGCVRGARAVIPMLTAQRSGHIVNIASFAGIANPPAMASYNAAKAAVISLSESLRFEMAPYGVGVSVACPSFFKTNLLTSSQSAGGVAAKASAAPQMEKIVQHLMNKATLTAEAVAQAIYDAVESKRFLVLPVAEDRRMALIKRVSPELYFRQALKATAKFLQRR
jgi:NAD(P)-dependent dehydrogenase (short-subunit alcohol dehydrogenase family)